MPTATLINLFEVEAGADDAFVDAWDRARAYHRARGTGEGAVLHRSLSPQAEFRFVSVAHIAAVDAWERAMLQPDYPGRDMPSRPHPGLFEIVREDPAPAGAPRVVLINAFEVPPGDDERFLVAWEATRAVMREHAGYLGTRLHRGYTSEAEFRFVNVARWASPEAFGAALRDPAFEAAALTVPHRSHPMLYEEIRP